MKPAPPAASPRRPVAIRRLGPEDGALIADLITRSEPEDLRQRFFHVLAGPDRAMVDRLTELDPAREAAFIALDGDGAALAVSRLHGLAEGGTAEFALFVRSDRQRRGLGRRMLKTAIGHARRTGTARLRGDILAENGRMLRLCRSLGFSIRYLPEMPGIAVAELDLSPVQSEADASMRLAAS